MAKKVFITLGLALVVSVSSHAQTPVSVGTLASPPVRSTSFVADSAIDLPRTSLPRMAPELALQVYTKRAAEQPRMIEEYSDRTLVEAELPETKQRGEFELIRNYRAPDSLNFAAVKFTGDGFVKSNVITKLLQSEVDHVRKNDNSLTAINERNYKISYKGLEDIEGASVHVFQLKPRQKIPGLFKGRIYIDAYTGSLRRAEGTMVKSPSFFVKKVEFTQDFADFSGVTLPTVLRSESKARIVGLAIVHIFHRGYELKTASPPVPPTVAAPTNALVGTP
jgi:hypothetical protein